MTKQTSLKKNTIANYIGQFYSILIGIIILPMYLKYLGAEAYGLVGFFTMLMSLMMLLDMGLTGTLARECAYNKDKQNGLFVLKGLIRSIEFLFFGVSILIFSGIYFASDIIALKWLNIHELSIQTVENSIKLMGAMIVMRWFVGFYQGAIVGFEQQVWLNIYKVFFNTLKFVGAFLLIKYVTQDIIYFFLYQLIVGIAEFLTIRLKVYRVLPKTDFLYPKLEPLKKIAPFALSIAFTSGIWIIFTQADKLLLSHYIPLSEYGYFTLVVIVSGAIIQISAPIAQAIQPRMTSLLSNGKKSEMITLYHQATQYVAIVAFSVVAIIISFSYELLYAWTGYAVAAKWAAPILFWYVLGYGLLSIGAFQYYLQYACGNLKYHVRFNVIFPIVTLPIIYFSIVNYGAIGAGKAWFIIHLVGFFIWPPFVHSKFAPGIHKDWMIKDILPAFMMSSLFIAILHTLQLDFTSLNRLEIFLSLIGIGGVLLIVNAISYKNIRKIVFLKIRGV